MSIGTMTARADIALAACAFAVCATASPAGAQRIYGTYRVLPAGETTKLGLHFLLDDDCRSRGAVTVNVVTPPTGGQILTQAGSGHPRMRVRSPLKRCEARVVQGTNVFYRATPGFTGTDRFVLEDVYPDGTAYQFPITVSVR